MDNEHAFNAENEPGADAASGGHEPGADPEIPLARILCPRCGTPVKTDARFCSECGKRINARLSTKRLARARRGGGRGFTSMITGLKADSEWRDTRNVIVFYVIMLAVTLTVGISVEPIDKRLFIHDLAMIAVVMSGFVFARGVMLGPLKKIGFPIWAYGLIVLGALGTFLYAHGFLWGINRIFGLENSGDSILISPFKEAGYGLFFPVLSIAVSAGILEELAFRGIIQGYLHKHLKPMNAILVTGIAFGIIHIQYINLPLFVMGVYFSWLRWKSGSIYPSILAHFCHNLTVVLVDWYDVI